MSQAAKTKLEAACSYCAMKWDATKRKYVDDKGKTIPDARIRQEVDDYISSNQEEIDRKSKDLLLGTITVAAFFEFLRKTIISTHGTAGIIAHGGEDQMSSAEWQAIGQKVVSELAYLENFETKVLQSQFASESIAADAASLVARTIDVPAGLETVVEQRVLLALMGGTSVDEAIAGALDDSVGTEAAESIAASVVGDTVDSRMADLIWGQVESRAGMYADAVWGTYQGAVKDRESDAGAVGVRRVCVDDSASCEECPMLATEEYVGMGEIVDIGDSACMGNCRCWLEFDYLNVEPLEIEREIYSSAPKIAAAFVVSQNLKS